MCCCPSSRLPAGAGQKRYLSSELRTCREIVRVPQGWPGGLEGKPRRQISHGLTKSSISARTYICPGDHLPDTVSPPGAPHLPLPPPLVMAQMITASAMWTAPPWEGRGVDAVIQTLHSLRALGKTPRKRTKRYKETLFLILSPTVMQ